MLNISLSNYYIYIYTHTRHAWLPVKCVQFKAPPAGLGIVSWLPPLGAMGAHLSDPLEILGAMVP